MESGRAAMPLSIEPVDLASGVAQDLIRALNGELLDTYPEPGVTHFRLDPEEVAPGRGVFLVCRQDGRAAGCGAIRLLDPATAEIKRMYTVPEMRGKGVGWAVLGRLAEEARALGAKRLVLETATRQRAAIALYERFGFTRIPPFGEYGTSPLCVCMEKPLGPAPVGV